jgi:AraC family transcriptional activator of pobA
MEWKSVTDDLIFYNKISLEIVHCNYGLCPGFEGQNNLPANRIYFISPTSLSGTIKNQNSGQSLSLNGGCIYFMPENIDLYYSFPKDFPLIGFHFNFYALPGLDMFSGCRDLRKITDFDNFSEKITHWLDSDINPRQVSILRAALLQVIAALLPEDQTPIQVKIQRQIAYKQILDFIHLNPNAGIRINELAEMMKLSRDMLSKNFARDFGISLKAYLTRNLLQYVCKQVLYTDRIIKEIAFDSGFNDEYYFSRFFKKHTGFSPLQYRHSFRKKQW